MLYENPVSGPGARSGGRPPATTAAWLTALFPLAGALANLIGVLRLGHDFWRDPGLLDNSLATIVLLGGLLLVATLIYGAVLILRGDDSGRFIVLLAAGAWAVVAAIGLVCTLVGYESEYGVHWFPEAGPLAAASFAQTGLPGAITALLAGDRLPALLALILPVLTVLVVAIPERRAR